MPSLFKSFWTRLTIDYREWYNDWIEKWNRNREIKQIDSAILRARERCARDRKTRYIIKDKRGAVNALTDKELRFWTKMGQFPEMNLYQRLERSIDIVTSNQNIIELNRKIKKSHERSDKTQKEGFA